MLCVSCGRLGCVDEAIDQQRCLVPCERLLLVEPDILNSRANVRDHIESQERDHRDSYASDRGLQH